MIRIALWVFFLAAAAFAKENADSLIVRSILDTNGMHDIPVDSVAGFSGGRVVRFHFNGCTYPANRFRIMPDKFGSLDSLQTLRLDCHDVAVLPPSMWKLKALDTLLSQYGAVTSLPSDICSLPRLSFLWMPNNSLSALPGCLMDMPSLKATSFVFNKLCALDPSLGSWLDAISPDWRRGQNCPIRIDSLQITALLRDMGLDGRPINEFARYDDSGRIVALSFNGLGIMTLPPNPTFPSALDSLDLRDNQFWDLPASLTQVPLISVKVENNQLCNLSESMAHWLDSLDPGWGKTQTCVTDSQVVAGILKENGINGKEVKNVAVMDPLSKRISALNLRGLGLKSIPGQIGRLTELTALDLGRNGLVTLPTVIGKLISLRSLMLDSNLLADLPLEITGILKVRLSGPCIRGICRQTTDYLNLAHNQLCALPGTVASWATTFDLGWEGRQIGCGSPISLSRLHPRVSLSRLGNTWVLRGLGEGVIGPEAWLEWIGYDGRSVKSVLVSLGRENELTLSPPASTFSGALVVSGNNARLFFRIPAGL